MHEHVLGQNNTIMIIAEVCPSTCHVVECILECMLACPSTELYVSSI